MNLTEILPHHGLGDLHFGMTREAVKELLGEPDDHQEERDAEEGVLTDLWAYHERAIRLTFDEDEGWRLVIIAVGAEEFELAGKSIIGLPMDDLMSELSYASINDFEFEDASSEEEPDRLLIYSEEKGINLWLQDDVLEEVQWGPEFSEDGAIIWPN